ncbi:hypothetical protein ScPMuIL_003323 [Solemya velum]
METKNMQTAERLGFHFLLLHITKRKWDRAGSTLPLFHFTKMGISVKDVNAHEFTKALAAFLKKTGKLKVPDWTDIVKLGRFKELAPYDEDWFYMRAASVCRHLYIRSPVGVGSLTKIYGGLKSNGTAPSHYCRASSSVARKVMQSLESLKLVDKDPNGGRRLTSSGRRDLDRIASQIKIKASPKVAK